MSMVCGVIGCGGISRFHFTGLARAGAEIAWACDRDEAAGRERAARHGARYSADYRDVLADSRVDAVVVATPSATHKQICIEAIAAGKAVICEKTLAVNARDALEIVQAAEAAGTVFYTSYMKRFIPAVEQAKALLPRLGRIVSTHVRTYQLWGNLWGENPPAGFFHTPATGASRVVRSYGGGILVCGGSHILDLVCFFLGRPTRLYASMHVPPGRDYDLQAAVLLETPCGVVHYDALAHPLDRIGFLRDGWDERVEINGLEGRLEIFSSAWDQVETKASLLIHYDNRTGRATEYRYEPVSPFDRALAFFGANIERGDQGGQSRVTGYDVDELIEAIQRSSRGHCPVEIEWKI